MAVMICRGISSQAQPSEHGRRIPSAAVSPICAAYALQGRQILTKATKPRLLKENANSAAKMCNDNVYQRKKFSFGGARDCARRCFVFRVRTQT